MKLLLRYAPNATILVLCYTNHALDQFLEDLLDMGVDSDSILRLGSKSTDRTESMMLRNHGPKRPRLSQAQYKTSQFYRYDAAESANETFGEGMAFSRWKQSSKDILESLDCDLNNAHFYEALTVPEVTDGVEVVGKSGKAINSFYLYERWSNGLDGGVFKTQVTPGNEAVWKMSKAEHQFNSTLD